jgi:hypothetical protein
LSRQTPNLEPPNLETPENKPGPAPQTPQVDDALVLTAPGSKEGETRVIREADGSVWAYGWSGARREWERIGEVVAAPEAGASRRGAARRRVSWGWRALFRTARPLRGPSKKADSGLKVLTDSDPHTPHPEP